MTAAVQHPQKSLPLLVPSRQETRRPSKKPPAKPAPTQQPSNRVHTRDLPDGIVAIGFSGVTYDDGAECESRKGHILLTFAYHEGIVYATDGHSVEWGSGASVADAVEDWADSFRHTYLVYVLDKRRLSDDAKKLRKRLRSYVSFKGLEGRDIDATGDTHASAWGSSLKKKGFDEDKSRPASIGLQDGTNQYRAKTHGSDRRI